MQNSGIKPQSETCPITQKSGCNTGVNHWYQTASNRQTGILVNFSKFNNFPKVF
jgi:hypothetical protein